VKEKQPPKKVETLLKIKSKFDLSLIGSWLAVWQAI